MENSSDGAARNPTYRTRRGSEERFDLEQALEFIEDDELVEVTPKTIRVRKRHLKELGRKRAGRV